MRRSGWTALLTALCAGAMPGQTLSGHAPAAVSVHGVAFDSLRRAPLAGAFVTLTAPERPVASATSDSLGRFRFDGVAPGAYVLALQHAVFDSIGISGTTARLAVTDGRDTVYVATPSFAQLWRAACGDRPPPRDSAFVFGTVRAADGAKPVSSGTVTLEWTDVAIGGRGGVSQHDWRADAFIDANGEYRACGVPASAVLRIRAGAATPSSPGDSLEAGPIDVIENSLRVQRVDLLLGARGAGAERDRGAVAGMVTNELGAPVAGARVRIAAALVRTDTAGRFVLAELPPGTQQIDVQSIGATPLSQSVDVVPRDTARVSLRLDKLTTLAPVNVRAVALRRALARAIAERRKLGLGYYKDSTEISNRPSVLSVFAAIPGVTLDHGRRGGRARVLFQSPTGMGKCAATLWIDGHRASFGQLDVYSPDDIAEVEVYPRTISAPASIPTTTNSCGTVLVWTKFYFP